MTSNEEAQAAFERLRGTAPSAPVPGPTAPPTTAMPPATAATYVQPTPANTPPAQPSPMRVLVDRARRRGKLFKEAFTQEVAAERNGGTTPPTAPAPAPVTPPDPAATQPMPAAPADGTPAEETTTPAAPPAKREKPGFFRWTLTILLALVGVVSLVIVVARLYHTAGSVGIGALMLLVLGGLAFVAGIFCLVFGLIRVSPLAVLGCIVALWISYGLATGGMHELHVQGNTPSKPTVDSTQTCNGNLNACINQHNLLITQMDTARLGGGMSAGAQKKILKIENSTYQACTEIQQTLQSKHETANSCHGPRTK